MPRGRSPCTQAPSAPSISRMGIIGYDIAKSLGWIDDPEALEKCEGVHGVDGGELTIYGRRNGVKLKHNNCHTLEVDLLA